MSSTPALHQTQCGASVWRQALEAPAAQRTRGDGRAKRNEYFAAETRFSSRGSSLYGLQKSLRRIDLTFDPEEQIPGGIPDPFQP
jgi:hypothetical protein